MQNNTIRNWGLVAAGLLLASTASAFDMGNMMNPSKWMGGGNKHDRYDDYYDGPGYGYGGGPGYGSGYGYGGAPGYGGMPGYGTAPAYGSAPAAAAPEADEQKKEIEQLKERIRKLEQGGAQTPAPAWGQPGYQYR